MSSEQIEVEILDPEKPIAAYNPVRAGIEQMREKYGKTVFSVATTKEMDATRAARAEVREVRYSVERIRKALKAPAVAYSKRIDDEAREYTAAILEIEAPIDELIKAEERRKADEKAAREAEEAREHKAIEERIWAIGQHAVESVGMSSAKVALMIESLRGLEITLDAFGDRAGEAEMVKQQTLVKLKEMHQAAEASEAEAARLARERAELERQRAEQERVQAEARAKAQAEEAKRQDEIRRQQEALRAQQEEIDRQRREVEEAKAAAARAEQERLNRIAAEEQAKVEAEARAAREKAEAEARAAREKAEARQAKAKEAAYTKLCEEGPGDGEIVRVLSEHYDVSASYVIGWLHAFDKVTL